MLGLATACSLYTPRDARNLRVFQMLLLLTALLFAASTLLIRFGWIPAPAGWALTLATAISGSAAIRVYVRFLHAADELLRKIQLEGLALGFGAGIIFMLVYRLLERLGAPKLDVVDPVVVLLLFWAAGQWIGYRRYYGGEES